MPIARDASSGSGFVGGSYGKDPLTKYTQSFIDLAKNVLTESSVDIFEEPKKVLRRPMSREALKEFFVNDFLDTNTNDVLLQEDGYVEDQIAMMEQQFENDANGILEHADLADYNPVIGMTFPIHKNILMNMVFDKGAIQKVVAESPKFTMTMEFRMLRDAQGNEIDMFTNQNDLTPAVDASNPVYEIELALPEIGNTDVLALCGGTKLDALSIRTHISYIQLDKVYVKQGDIKPDDHNVIKPNGPVATAEDEGEVENVWYPVRLEFLPGYNEYERTFNAPISITVRKDADTMETIKDTLAGTMDHNVFNIMTANGATSRIKKVMLSAVLDTSNAMVDTATVFWKTKTVLREIPDAVPVSATISPTEIKDLAALYQVNQLTKIMSLLKTVMANYKDDKIKAFLDQSYDRLPAPARGYGEFDYAVPNGYALDHLTYRFSTFFDFFDTEVTKMLQVLNDPNVVITVFGDPDLIRKITPTQYTYQTPSSIGPVELDYTRTVVTSDKRVYQFIGSDKLRWNDNLVVILCPRNSNRVIYRIYDYQMYISNEIRNIMNPALPNVYAFDRFLVDEFQPVQTRIKILNRSGRRESQTP